LLSVSGLRVNLSDDVHPANHFPESGEALAPDIGCAHHHPARVENGRVMLALRDAG